MTIYGKRKIVILENLTTYNDKIQDKITTIDDRLANLIRELLRFTQIN